MELGENLYMGSILMMKTFKEDMLMLDYFQWLIMEETQIHHSIS
jgi:hypothetical protein